ncbi:MAG: type II toxin-antitoxin system Phd/YefM family antitoxin [Verrucomicrobia bacterium]|nr:type II toxin-antitoxin system Phd/YefM family antitoxin [Verrucomicrobiota bacterium]
MRTELVTTLKRRATEIITGLQSDRSPILITQHGKPAAYLVDVDSYDELNRRLSVIEGIALGEQAVRDGRTVSQTQAKRRFSKWLK